MGFLRVAVYCVALYRVAWWYIASRYIASRGGIVRGRGAWSESYPCNGQTWQARRVCVQHGGAGSSSVGWG